MSRAALLILLLFSLTLFVSATLLFLVQPMVGKMLLPMLGGTPAVWNTCMVFFQAMLLAGYAYAHATTAWLGVRRQAALHLGVLLLPVLTLQLTVDRDLLDYGEGSPIPGLLLVLLISVGLPFFVLSTTAPLLQKWFAGTGHPAARDPYFLYGASNLGSMLALFSYPAVLEPWLPLAAQRLLWQIGYGVLAVLVALCAVVLWQSQGTTAQGNDLGAGEGRSTPATTTPRAPAWGRRLRWVALSFVPSSLMLGVTTYMTTDIAAIPLLWVLPLGLYLLSFILVFSRLPAWVHRLMVVLLPFFVLALVFLMLSEYPLLIWWKIAVHLATLFVAAMVCHGELARDRPDTRHLTEYYLWMSFGGVLGGLFNALIAPVVFNGVVEYPLALVLVCLLTPVLEGERPSRLGPILGAWLAGLFLGCGIPLLVAALGRGDLNWKTLTGAEGVWCLLGVAVAVILVLGRRDAALRASRWLDLLLPFSLGLLTVGLNLGLRLTTMDRGLQRLFDRARESLSGRAPDWVPRLFDVEVRNMLMFFVPVALCYVFVRRPLRFGLAVGAVFLASSLCALLNDDLLLRDRSFFGVLQVADNGVFHLLHHGTTLHGAQRRRWDENTLAACAIAPFAAQEPLSRTGISLFAQDVWNHPRREALTYFHRTGPIGQVFAAYERRLAGRHVGLIGLGSGTLASYGRPGQQLIYFEIDPLVKEIAYNRNYFTFVQDAIDRGVQVELVLGDARLKLEGRAWGPNAKDLALLVVDAFSSDSIPMHLITREALEIYLANLADDGLVAFHISNRYLDLEPVLGNLAQELDMAGLIQLDSKEDIAGKTSSSWAVLARRAADLQPLLDADHGLRRGAWRELKTRPEVGVWTDDFSNLLRVFNWKN